MKYSEALLIFTIVILCTSGCFEPFATRSYITDINYEPQRLCAREWNMYGQLYLVDYLKKLSFESTGNDKELFDNICDIYGDNEYYRLRRKNNDLSPWCSICYPHIKSVSITSDKDYNKDHPHGTSLNDLILASYNSPRKYILNNYTGPKDDFATKILSKLTETDFAPSSGFIEFYFTCTPDVREPHTLHFEVTLADGKVLTTSLVYNFEREYLKEP